MDTKLHWDWETKNQMNRLGKILKAARVFWERRAGFSSRWVVLRFNVVAKDMPKPRPLFRKSPPGNQKAVG
jgi:hypothetical protein